MYMVTTHSMLEIELPRERLITGRTAFTTLESRADMKVPTPTASRTHHSRLDPVLNDNRLVCTVSIRAFRACRGIALAELLAFSTSLRNRALRSGATHVARAHLFTITCPREDADR